MPESVLIVLVLLFVGVPILAFREGNHLAWRQAKWLVSKSQEGSNLAEQVEQARQETAALRQSVTDMARILEKLDHSHGQLVLRMVNQQMKVRGLQHGEEASTAEAIMGRRATVAPTAPPDEPETEGFLIDGKPVDPKVGIQRAIASAKPT